MVGMRLLVHHRDMRARLFSGQLDVGFAARETIGRGRLAAVVEDDAVLLAAQPLEHVPKKLRDFFDSDMLHVFESERFLIDHVIPRDREAL